MTTAPGPIRVLPSHFDATALRPRSKLRRHTSFAAFWKRHWNGQYSLGRSYWLHFRLGQLALVPVLWLIGYALDSAPLRVSCAIALLLPLLLSVITAWQVRGTWLAARQHLARSRTFGRVTQAVLVLELFFVHLPAYAKGWVNIPDNVAAVFGQTGLECIWETGHDRSVIVLRGGLGEDAGEQLEQALLHVPSATTVQLESEGGLTAAGKRVASIIKERGLNTYVEHRCSSACTLAFLAGREREMATDAQLGFHQVRPFGSMQLSPTVNERLTREFYADDDLPQEFIERIAQTAASSMWFPKRPYLLEIGVLTR